MALDTVLTAVGEGAPERSERLVETLIDVAGPADATVVLGHIFTESEFEEVRDDLGFSVDAAPDDVVGRYQPVRDLADRLERADVDYAVTGAVGEHAPLIVELAEEVDADMVFVGGKRRSPAGKAMFGSTSQQVLLNASCPVTLVRDNDSWRD